MPRPERGKERRIAKVMTGVSSTEALVGAGATVLGILGLVGIWPFYMAAVATIVIGAALVIEGAGIAAQYRNIMSQMNGSRYERAELGGGATNQTLGGLAGITLGILALVGVVPSTLLPVAVIVFGSAIVLGATAPRELESAVERYERYRHTESESRHVAHEAVQATEGTQVLVGLGSIVLGILVLTDVGAPAILILVALLSIGAAEFLRGSALGSRMGLALRVR